jgi:putative lipoic acid-binding regulatory protein
MTRRPTANVAHVLVRPGVMFDGLKVFSATMHAVRDQLGETVTAWIREHVEFEITECVVRQSSDAQFHCITIIVFYRRINTAP